ncbi:hypothetical protein IG631_17204 [Alternaria alternata]|nr:hypothetical protein IG631_17204 [Alternaria alternata]
MSSSSSLAAVKVRSSPAHYPPSHSGTAAHLGRNTTPACHFDLSRTPLMLVLRAVNDHLME